MQNLIKLVINDNEVLQYDKNVKLPDNQNEYLKNMDIKMDQGIILGNQNVTQPEQLQKAQFVTLNMLSFLDNNQEQEAIAMFSYLVNYMSELKQVKVLGKPGNYKIEFVLYKDFSQWDTIKFQ